MNNFTQYETRALSAWRRLGTPEPLAPFTKLPNGAYLPFTERLRDLRRSREPASPALRLCFNLHEQATVASVAIAALHLLGLDDEVKLDARVAEDRLALASKIEATTAVAS
jgi:hypothetical protein